MEHRFDARPRLWLDLFGDSKTTGAPEDAAEEFYKDYSRCVGFIMRIGQCCRSDVDKRVLSRRLGGRSVKTRDQVLSVRRPRPTTRECCKAMMLVKLDKSGKWVITRVVKDHAHPHVVSAWNSMDAKDMKIAELTMDLGREEQLCGQYHELLLTLLNNVEEETELMATKVRGVVNHVREFETDVEGLPQNQMEAKVRGLPPNQTVTEVQGLPESIRPQLETELWLCAYCVHEHSTDVLLESILTD